MKNQNENSKKKSLKYALLVTVLVVSLALTVAKFTQKTEDQIPPETSEPKDIDILRSLPYLGSIDIKSDEESGVTLYDQNNSCPGYNLYTIRQLSTAELIDMDGNVINSWSFPSGNIWVNVELLSNGDLLVVGGQQVSGNEKDNPYNDNIKDRYLLRFDWKGNLLWKKTLPAHHDVELSADGKLFVLCKEYKIIPEIHPEYVVRDTMFARLDKDGRFIESKSLYDAVKDSESIFPLQKVKANRGFVDLFHTNSFEKMYHEHLFEKHPLYEPDNVLISVRHQDRIAIINWPENKIVWAWGQNIISGPHDATLLENGHILLFDNGLGRKYSRIVELDPITKQIVWQYQAENPTDFYTYSRGSAQRLPNGNTLVAESDKGKAFEITPEGKKVWEFLCPHVTKKDGKRAIIIRMKKYTVQLIDEIIKIHNEK